MYTKVLLFACLENVSDLGFEIKPDDSPEICLKKEANEKTRKTIQTLKEKMEERKVGVLCCWCITRFPSVCNFINYLKTLTHTAVNNSLFQRFIHLVLQTSNSSVSS